MVSVTRIEGNSYLDLLHLLQLSIPREILRSVRGTVRIWPGWPASGLTFAPIPIPSSPID